MNDPTSRDLVTRPKAAAEAYDLGHVAPEPGQYWRLRTKLQKARTQRASHPSIDAGTVLLVLKLESADGVVHSVHLAPHPAWPSNTSVHLRLDDFLTDWDLAVDAEAVRAAEIRELNLAMTETQRAMLSPPPAVTLAGLLEHEPSSSMGAEGQALATPEGLLALTMHADVLKAQALATQSWISEHSAKLRSQGATLAAFHHERAEALTARALQQLEQVNKIREIVAKLSYYTGQDVHCGWLHKGAPAPVDEPLTIYQDVLSLDAETLLLLDQGGLDHRDVEALSVALRDPALRTQLIPTQRGAVLCRFRSTDKVFYPITEGMNAIDVYLTSQANADANREAQVIHLLIRDGESMALVESPELFSRITQLLPNSAEQDRYYTRQPQWHDTDKAPERITPDDLDYAAAQRKQLGALNDYAKVLIVLWGLHDREEIFAHSAIPKFSNWLDPGFQLRHLRLVSHDNLIGVAREDANAFRDRHNRYLCQGAMVAVLVHPSIDEETAGGLFGPQYYDHGRKYHRRNAVYEYDGPDVAIATVRVHQAKAYIDIEAAYRGYRDKSQRPRIKAKLLLTHRQHILVLDRVHGEDLDYYLGSRSERLKYAAYVALFREARVYVRQRDAAEAPLRDMLARAVHDAALPHATEALQSAITEAIAATRVVTKNELSIESVGDRKRLLNALHASLTDNRTRIIGAEAWATSHRRTPVALVREGRGTWSLDTVLAPEERDPRFPMRSPFVGRATIEYRGDGSVHVSEIARRVHREDAGEVVLHQWAGTVAMPKAPVQRWPKVFVGTEHDQAPSAEPIARAPAESMSYHRWLKVFESIELASALLAEREELAHAFVAEAERAMRSSRSRYVTRIEVIVPIGTALHVEISPIGNGEHQVRERGPVLVAINEDGLVAAYRLGSESVRTACVQQIERWYTEPADHVAALHRRGAAAFDVVHVVRPDDYARLARSPWFVGDGLDGRSQSHEDWRVPSKRPGPRQHQAYRRLTSLSEAGARLFPDLLRVCERASASLPKTPTMSTDAGSQYPK